MKQTRAWIGLMATLLLGIWLAAEGRAETEIVDGISWTYKVSGGVASVGSGVRSSTAVSNSTTGTLSIPGTLGSYPVKSIGDYAFYKCDGLTNVTIPSSVTNIGSRAFYDCTALASVTIPDSVTCIGTSAFQGCSRLPSVTIPDSVTSIGNYAFLGCTGLGWISIPQCVCSKYLGYIFSFYSVSYQILPNISMVEIREGVTNIGVNAFSGSQGLTSVVIPSTVSTIGKGAFSGCTNLESVTIPNGVTCIEEETFSGCSNLSAITIPDNISCIGKRAFVDCSGLKTLVIPASVTNIAASAFSFCGGMERFQVDEGNLFYASNDGILFTKDMQTILQVPGTRNGTYTTPENVTDIGGYAFICCTGLTSVVIGDNVRTIGGSSFYGCSNLMSLTIGNSVERIASWAFFGCTELVSVTIPASVKSILPEAFSYCDGLQAIYVASDNEDFTSVDGVLFSKNLDTILQFPGARGGAYVIPDSVTIVKDYAFSTCQNLTAVTIPDSVQRIRFGAFQGCSNLQSVAIGDGVEILDWYVFRDCVSLTSVRLPESVKSVGLLSFSGCSGLKTLSVPGAWEGTEMLADARVPEGCEVIYRPDPESVVSVPHDWLETNAADILAANDMDYEKTANAKAANGMRVWECYVAGLSPTNETAEFQVKSITFVDGQPQVKWEPDLNEGGTETERTYCVEGKKMAEEEEWTDVTDIPNLDTEGWRFFRVRVGMPE